MARMKTQVTQELADYLALHARQDEVLARVERDTAELPMAMMATTPDEAALLEMLARLVGARNALEIGTFTGYGAISIARGLAEGGSLTCLEVSEEFAEIARRNIDAAGLTDRVEIRLGPADEALRAMPEEPTFDYVFIDADKKAYPTYYDLVVPRLVPGGSAPARQRVPRRRRGHAARRAHADHARAQRPGHRGRARRQRDDPRRRRAHARAQALDELLGDGEAEALDRRSGGVAHGPKRVRAALEHCGELVVIRNRHRSVRPVLAAVVALARLMATVIRSG